MREIPLTQGYVAVVDDRDYKRVSAYKWHAQVERRKDGSVKAVYARRNKRVDEQGYVQHLHRFIMGVDDPTKQVDHRDHNGLNNRRKNLRRCSNAQNQANRRVDVDNRSGFKGVAWKKDKGKYQSRITVNGKMKFLGYFSDKKLAAEAYQAAAKSIFGEFACQ